MKKDKFKSSVIVEIKTSCSLKKFKEQIEKLIDRYGEESIIIDDYDTYNEELKYEILEIDP